MDPSSLSDLESFQYPYSAILLYFLIQSLVRMLSFRIVISSSSQASLTRSLLDKLTWKLFRSKQCWRRWDGLPSWGTAVSWPVCSLLTCSQPLLSPSLPIPHGCSSPIHLDPSLSPPLNLPLNISVFPHSHIPCLRHPDNFYPVSQFLSYPIRSLLFAVRPVLVTLSNVVFLPLKKFVVEFFQGHTSRSHSSPSISIPCVLSLLLSYLQSVRGCASTYLITFLFLICPFCWIANYQIFLQFPVYFHP